MFDTTPISAAALKTSPSNGFGQLVICEIILIALGFADYRDGREWDALKRARARNPAAHSNVLGDSLK